MRRGSISSSIVAVAVLAVTLDCGAASAAPPPSVGATPVPRAFLIEPSQLLGKRYILIEGILHGHPFAAADRAVTNGSVTLVKPRAANETLDYHKKHGQAVASATTDRSDGSFRIDEGSYTTYVSGKAVETFDFPDGDYEIWARARSRPVILGPVHISHSRPLRFKNSILDMGLYSVAGGADDGNAQVVFYATDRTVKDLLSNNVGDLFSLSPEREIDPCTVTSTPPGTRCYMTYGQLTPMDPSDPNKATARNQKAASVDELLRYIHSAFPNAQKILVFVHGYNQNFVDPWNVAARTVAALDPQTPVILYSWPSTDRLLKYFDDETNNTWGAVHFEDFLQDLLQNSDAPPTIELLAHSMGNRLIVNALDASYRAHLHTAPLNGTTPCIFGSDTGTDALRPGCHHFGQVVFAAPDVDSATFYEAVPHMAAVADGLTLYGSNHDKALTLSRDLHGHCRAGLIGCDTSVSKLLHNFNAIDASLFACDFLDHGYWSSSYTMKRDIARVFAGGTMPPNAAALRPLLQRSSAANPNLYSFVDIDPSDLECAGDPNRTFETNPG